MNSSAMALDTVEIETHYCKVSPSYNSLSFLYTKLILSNSNCDLMTKVKS